jgi:GxxExxY protein
MAPKHPEHDDLTSRIIGAAIEVHRHIGPGLLESTYEECMLLELSRLGVKIESQLLLPVFYKGQRLNATYRPDLLVQSRVIVEIKCVEKLLAVHGAQVLTYLKHANCKVGLLFNFNEAVLKHGIRRFSL